MHYFNILWKLMLTLVMFGSTLPKYCSANSVIDGLVNKGKRASRLPGIDSNEKDIREVGDMSLISVPFEELGNEDKFLIEAGKINSITFSTLDRCEQKVIMQIHSSCSDMTEEDLAKLSIRLLNCQLEISGKNQVLCSEEMTLKECTSPMDSESWNAYHIINNRARAVCYAVRQQQFRALSEMAVNKLMSSTLTQITSMDNLQELQKELNVLTADTISSLKKGQLELLDYTGELQQAQSRAQHSIARNMKQLVLEQTLIQNTHNQLTTLSEKLVKLLETHGSQFNTVNDQQHRALEEILAGLSEITANTGTLWTAIEKKSQHILQQQEKIKKSNSETLEHLKHINMSVLYLSNIVTQIKIEVERKVVWATDFLGGDGALLIAVLLNALYLIAGVLVTLFLQLSLIYRLALLMAVGTNILLVYQHQALSYLDLTVLIVGSWVFISLLHMGWLAYNKYKTNSSKNLNTQKKEPIQEEFDDNVSTSSSRSENVSENYRNHKRISSIDHNDLQRINSFSGLHLRKPVSTPESSSQSVCAAQCRNGQLCRSTPIPGREFCRRHLPR